MDMIIAGSSIAPLCARTAGRAKRKWGVSRSDQRIASHRIVERVGILEDLEQDFVE
jgi:hypothetical protein